MTTPEEEAVREVEVALAEERFADAKLRYERAQTEIDAWDAGATAFALGCRLDEVGDIKGAERFYRRAVAANPDLTPYRQNLAALLFEGSRYAEAQSLLEAIVRDTTDACDLRSVCLEWLDVIARAKR